VDIGVGVDVEVGIGVGVGVGVGVVGIDVDVADGVLLPALLVSSTVGSSNCCAKAEDSKEADLRLPIIGLEEFDPSYLETLGIRKSEPRSIAYR